MIETALQFIGGFVFCLAYLGSLIFAVSILGKRLSDDHKMIAMILTTIVIYFIARISFNV